MRLGLTVALCGLLAGCVDLGAVKAFDCRPDGTCGPVDAGGGADAGGVDAGCGALTFCGQGCADLSSDDLHCGSCTQACAVSERCAAGRCLPTSCASGADCPDASVCVDGAHCVPRSCVDVTCDGGTCDQGTCVNQQCGTQTCATGFACRGGTCVDVWCQGVTCPTTDRCVAGACVAPSCTDGMQNGTETGIDCGGSGCLPCGNDAGCGLPRDCASHVCHLQACVACASQSDCPMGELCLGGRCSATCQGGTTCQGGLVCDLDAGLCTTCASASQCPSASACTGNGTCGACLGALQCRAQEGCLDGGICGPCTSNQDCGAGRWCGGATCLTDECASQPCGAAASCMNTDAGHTCTCGAGYAPADGGCADINECAGGVPPCGAGAVCTNLPGSFSCACGPGLRGDGGVCVADCTLPWGVTLASGQAVTAWQASAVTCGNACASEQRTCSDGGLSGSFTAISCVVASCSSCPSPCGVTTNGATCTAWQTALPTGACVSEVRTCTNGSLSGSYANGSCTAGCSSPCGGLASGQSCTSYQASSVPYGSSCVSEVRGCTNGSLSGSYTNASCTVQGPASCSSPCGTIASGASCTAYQASSPAGACVSEIRTCTNGSLSGSYANGSCTAGCSSPCGGLTSGQSCTAYQAASVPYGNSCVSEVRGCTNGSLSGSYTNASCTVQGPGSCSSPCGAIASGQSCTAYQAASVPYGNSCVSEVRGCTNGSLSGSYTNASCTVQGPASCSSPCGTIASGASCTAYQASSPAGACVSEIRTCTNGSLSGSYTNGSCTAGCSSPCGGLTSGQSCTAYQAASVPYGSSCVSEVRGCTNGSLSGSYTNASCTVMPGASCTLPWSGTIADGQSVTAWTASPTSCSGTCSSELRTCTNGTLSGSLTSQSCTVPGCTWLFTGSGGPCYGGEPTCPAPPGAACTPFGSWCVQSSGNCTTQQVCN